MAVTTRTCNVCLKTKSIGTSFTKASLTCKQCQLRVTELPKLHAFWTAIKGL